MRKILMAVGAGFIGLGAGALYHQRGGRRGGSGR